MANPIGVTGAYRGLAQYSYTYVNGSHQTTETSPKAAPT